MSRETSAKLRKVFKPRFKILSRGVESGAVMALMLFEETERDVRVGKRLVMFTIYMIFTISALEGYLHTSISLHCPRIKRCHRDLVLQRCGTYPRLPQNSKGRDLGVC